MWEIVVTAALSGTLASIITAWISRHGARKDWRRSAADQAVRRLMDAVVDLNGVTFSDVRAHIKHASDISRIMVELGAIKARAGSTNHEETVNNAVAAQAKTLKLIRFLRSGPGDDLHDRDKVESLLQASLVACRATAEGWWEES